VAAWLRFSTLSQHAPPPRGSCPSIRYYESCWSKNPRSGSNEREAMTQGVQTHGSARSILRKSKDEGYQLMGSMGALLKLPS
jgi:hypothetical protein